MDYVAEGQNSIIRKSAKGDELLQYSLQSCLLLEHKYLFLLAQPYDVFVYYLFHGREH